LAVVGFVLVAGIAEAAPRQTKGEETHRAAERRVQERERWPRDFPRLVKRFLVRIHEELTVPNPKP
jgi:hypothetical protein